MALFPYVVGRSQRFYCKTEATQNTWLPPVADDACKVIQTSFKRSQVRKKRDDAKLTREETERITGQTTVQASIEVYVNPYGSVGTPPDCHPLLLSHFGTYANSTTGGYVGGAGTASNAHDTYSGSDEQTAIGSVSLEREFNAGTATTGIMSQIISGFTANILKIALKGGDEPRFTFEGEGYDMVSTTYTTNFAEVGSGVGTVTVRNPNASRAVTDNAGVLRMSPVFSFGTNIGTLNTGYALTAVDATGTIWTFTPPASGTIAAGTAILPYVPAETVHGSPIAGILGSLSFDATARGDGTVGGVNTGTGAVTTMPIVECSIERNNGMKYFHDVAFQDKMLDYVPGDVETKVNLTLRARRDHCIWLAEHESAIATQYPVILTCGSGATRVMRITMPRIEFDDVEIDLPQGDDVGMVKLSGMAMGLTGGSAAISLAFIGLNPG